MRRDLQGLEITKGELRRLSGVSVDDLIRPSTLEAGEKRSNFLYKETLVVCCLTIILFVASLIVGDLIAWQVKGLPIDLAFPNRPPWVVLTAMAIATCLSAILTRLLWLKNNTNKSDSLLGLLDDVENYNDLIKAIDLNDQLEEVGNPGVQLTNREEIIDALELTRQDLLRALRTERILRENKNFIQRNPELFANNLNALEALQVSDKASERGRLLNEALQIALNTQGELRKMQNRRPHY
ncbi:hypothetical protein [Phormidium sp. CCY1219]|uniref:hypothetical protein n=1 Tax=Phormidium sp. CCY1219 TaxID=2886104 RepID=UPI002D1E8E8B|nr:hypothetical protein [Phormidium sp. CCY1219]MEB3826287.1 hypothetical protein [Phormidium sp. CCY1219]